jgi:hypothetical protein
MGSGAVFHDNRVEIEPIRSTNGAPLRGSIPAAAG